MFHAPVPYSNLRPSALGSIFVASGINVTYQAPKLAMVLVCCQRVESLRRPSSQTFVGTNEWHGPIDIAISRTSPELVQSNTNQSSNRVSSEGWHVGVRMILLLNCLPRQDTQLCHDDKCTPIFIAGSDPSNTPYEASFIGWMCRVVCACPADQRNWPCAPQRHYVTLHER